MSRMDHCRQRIQDAVDDIGDNRLLEEDAMAREVGEINDGDLVENKNANDKIEGDNNAFQILLNMRAYGEAWIAKSFFVFMFFFMLCKWGALHWSSVRARSTLHYMRPYGNISVWAVQTSNGNSFLCGPFGPTQ